MLAELGEVHAATIDVDVGSSALMREGEHELGVSQRGR